MTKLVYPENGIYKECRDNLESCSNNLSKTKGNCSFSIPSGFSYSGYLSGLGQVINKYLKESKSINYKLKETNDRFQDLSDDLEENTKKIVPIKVKERERMIV